MVAKHIQFITINQQIKPVFLKSFLSFMSYSGVTLGIGVVILNNINKSREDQESNVKIQNKLTKYRLLESVEEKIKNIKKFI